MTSKIPQSGRKTRGKGLPRFWFVGDTITDTPYRTRPCGIIKRAGDNMNMELRNDIAECRDIELMG